MEKKLQYVAPVTEMFSMLTENALNMNPLSGTNIKNKAKDDNRDAGSIGLDNSGDFGSITPAKRQSLWDDDEEEDFY